MLTKETIEEYIADGNAVMLPGVAAKDIVNCIMGLNQGVEGDSWTTQSIGVQVSHAYNHIVWAFEEAGGTRKPNDEDHLAHALTRLAMAITLRERQADELH